VPQGLAARGEERLSGTRELVTEVPRFAPCAIPTAITRGTTPSWVRTTAMEVTLDDD